jgi:putative PEP-CTERM system integral membrane protein
VLAIPLAAYQLPNTRPTNIAVVLDRSYSMARHTAAIKAALAEIAQVNPKADVYLTAPAIRGEPPTLTTLDVLQPRLDQVVYFGGQDSAELLTQFAGVRALRSTIKDYDAVLVLTDDSGYELNNDAREVGAFDVPIWMVHLDRALPLGYTDKMLEAIQASGGGVVTTVADAFMRIEVQQQPNAVADISGDYAWLTLPTSEVANVLPSTMVMSASVQTIASTDPFAAFAARRLVLADMQRNRSVLGQNETLDALHKIATEQSIITPYSSMIVLVNDEQRRQLDELEKKGDRFTREKEAVGETNNGGQPIVTGVPEPHEWLLIGLAVVMLAGYAWRRKRLLAVSG